MESEKPREIAYRVLRGREAGGGYTEWLLDRELAEAHLGGPDRALAQELACGIVRWQAALDWLIDQRTDGRRQRADVRTLLRLGLYQLFWLSRVPDHAAVNETVALARRHRLESQAGFINAVLRNYAREKDDTRRRLAELQTTDPAMGWSHPSWLVARWTQRYGAATTAALLAWNNEPPRTWARANTLRSDAARLLERWREENVEYDFGRWDWVPENLVFQLKAHPALADLGSFRDGWFYLQDPSTLLAPYWLAPQPGETVLDFCAAPGGKTTFIAQLMENQGRILAVDCSPDRLGMLRRNCARLGVTCVEALLAEIPAGGPTGPSLFDRVLVDAPCSNTGVIRRRVDLRWRVTLAEIERLSHAQALLLAAAAAQVKLGGALVYSTCSLEPEENELVVANFLREDPRFTLTSQRMLLPFQDSVDGAYVACLRRQPHVMRSDINDGMPGRGTGPTVL